MKTKVEVKKKKRKRAGVRVDDGADAKSIRIVVGEHVYDEFDVAIVLQE